MATFYFPLGYFQGLHTNNSNQAHEFVTDKIHYTTDNQLHYIFVKRTSMCDNFIYAIKFLNIPLLISFQATQFILTYRWTYYTHPSVQNNPFICWSSCDTQNKPSNLLETSRNIMKNRTVFWLEHICLLCDFVFSFRCLFLDNLLFS